MPETASFGRWLRECRRALDLTQQELARQAGCSGETIRKIEAGTLRPSKQLAVLLADRLGIQSEDRAAFVQWARAAPAGEPPRPAAPPQTPPPPTAPPPAAPPASPRAPLPVPPTPLIGREREVAQVRALLWRVDVRLVTLSGPPGIGKTRLALQAAIDLAGDFADGVAFVPLVEIGDPALVPAAIARSLGLRDAAGRSLGEMVEEHLRDRRLLLVLDNFEQVLGAAPRVAELLAAGPGVKVLITSRAVLHLRGEREIAVPPLALPDRHALPPLPALRQVPAVALFVQRAQEGRPDFVLTDENAATVTAICHRLEGLPLAIELAAARIKMLSSGGLLQRLEHRLALLTHGASDLPAHQRTLRSAIAWSYELLPETEQRLFRRLGVFVGGWTLEAAVAVGGEAAGRPAAQAAANGAQAQAADRHARVTPAAPGPAQSPGPPTHTPADLAVLDGLAALLDKTLVQRQGAGDSEPRFAMLEMIREYVLERLAESGEAAAIRHRHALYYLAQAEEADARRGGADWAPWLARLEPERGNLRAALAWTVAGQRGGFALQLAAALTYFWSTRGDVSEGRQWLAAALALAEGAPPALRATALQGAATLAWDQQDAAADQVYSEQSLAIWRALDDRPNVARSLAGLGLLATRRGDYAQAVAHHTEALGLYREAAHPRGIASCLSNLGYVALMQEDYPRAAALCAESLALFREQGGVAGILVALQNLGFARLGQGDYGAAAPLFRESVGVAQQLGYQPGLAAALVGLAGIAGGQGQPARAARLGGAVAAHGPTIEIPLDPSAQAAYDQMLAAAQAALEAVAFQTAWANGQALSFEQAITYALEESAPSFTGDGNASITAALDAPDAGPAPGPVWAGG